MGIFNAGAQMFYTRPSDLASYCFSPVPLLAASKEFLRTADNETRLAVVNQLTFNGTLLPTLPALSGITGASCLQLLDRKSDQLCSALEDYGSLVVVDNSGYTVLNVVPRVASVNFDESQIVNRRDYSIVFEYESEFGNDRVREFNEDWSFEQQEDDTVGVTHNISAVGISDSGVNSSITNARNFVLSKIAGSSPNKTQSVLLKQPFVQSIVDVDNLGAYNYILTETSDITAGSYTASETWTLSSGNFKDDRTIEHVFDLNELNNLIETININGTVQGYGDTTFDKITNALSGFNTVVVPQINFSAVSGIVSKNFTENRFAGTVSYSLSRAPLTDEGQLEGRSIQRSIERNDDGSVTQTVTTTAALRAGASGTIQDAIDFCFANNSPVDSAEPIFDASLSGNIVSISTQRDDITRTFSLTRSFTDQLTSLYTEEFTVQRQENIDTSNVTITVQGTIQGLGQETSTKSTARFASASGAYFGTIEPLIRDRALVISPTGTCITSNPITSTLGYNQLVGVITYSQSFDSRFLTNNINIIKEDIEINFANRSDVIAQFEIPGKADGPVLQDLETKTGLEKTLRITYTMASSTGNCINSVASSNDLLSIALSESAILINNTPTANPRGEKPESSAVFKTSDTHSWARQSRVFNRNVTWKYI